MPGKLPRLETCVEVNWLPQPPRDLSNVVEPDSWPSGEIDTALVNCVPSRFTCDLPAMHLRFPCDFLAIHGPISVSVQSALVIESRSSTKLDGHVHGNAVDEQKTRFVSRAWLSVMDEKGETTSVCKSEKLCKVQAGFDAPGRIEAAKVAAKVAEAEAEAKSKVEKSAATTRRL